MSPALTGACWVDAVAAGSAASRDTASSPVSATRNCETEDFVVFESTAFINRVSSSVKPCNMCKRSVSAKIAILVEIF